MIHSLVINNFRIFHDCHIQLGANITAICGKNGVGKSTLLALLGNSCELKKYKTISGSPFKTKFSEIFKGCKEFDKSGSNKCIINFSDYPNIDDINDKKYCRITWPKDRFRVITETKNSEHKNSRKKELPSLYLGLSRLLPIGEALDKDVNIKSMLLKTEERDFFFRNYDNILNLSMENYADVSIDSINIQNSTKKIGVGISTSNYSSIMNSSGQDNIGQILLSILSFKRLKDNLKDQYKGGLLLIDEIEATLHPLAQNKLVDFLYSQCKELNLQVIFTTHSLSLLEYICTKTSHNSKTNINNYQLVFITKNNGPLEIVQNPDISIIQNDLNIAAPGSNINTVTVYSEDDEARWLFKTLLGNSYINFVKIINITLGCNELLKLNKCDPQYFSNILFVLDGDVEQKNIDNIHSKNIIKLPGSIRPEELIYNFLLNLDPNSPFWSSASSYGLNKESLKEHGPNSRHYQGRDRERFKKWFNDNRAILEQLEVLNIWEENNKVEYDNFINSFLESINYINSKNGSPLIKKINS